ncbi:hypothetical protein SLA2020_430960 [Shorea laevis]
MYVNYGSVTVMTKDHLKEFAWGLANSKHSFLWIVRPDVVVGDSAILPNEFFEETKDRGLLVSWCPQDQVLAHPSIAVFLTHWGTLCGKYVLVCLLFAGHFSLTNKRIVGMLVPLGGLAWRSTMM